MKLSEHLDKGIWTVADKTLLLLYGFGVIVLVVNVLPKPEWGAFSLFQSIFLILCVLADSIFLQPMVKFAAEHEAEVDYILAAGFNLYTISILVAGGIIASIATPLAAVFTSPELGAMLHYLPVLITLSVFRNVAIRYLQIDLRINAIFWVDLAFFGSILVLTVLASAFHLFHTAADFMYLNMVGAALSSLVAIFFCSKALFSMPLLRVPSHEYSRMLSFAKFQAGTSALLTLQQWSDVLIVGVFYTPSEVAIYSAAKNIYRFLDAVREGATLLVVPMTSKLYTQKDFEGLSTLIEQLLFASFVLLVPLSFVLAVGSPLLFHILYKGQYDAGAVVFQILILSGFTLPLALIGTNALIGMGKAKELFLATLGAVTTFFIASYFLTPRMASRGQALAVLISMTLLAFLQFFAMRAELNLSARGIMRRAQDARKFVASRGKKAENDSPG
ncbi:MAG TPA: oligosaccharide flippase family protein [Candidatus Kapabacteria bacterium]